MRFFTKKNKAIKNWHSRAMVIDLSKTKVIMINKTDLDYNIPSWKRGKSETTNERLNAEPSLKNFEFLRLKSKSHLPGERAYFAAIGDLFIS